MYRLPDVEEPLSQGDIVESCPLSGLPPDASADSDPVAWRARVVVLTQACDLATAKTNQVVVAMVHDAQELVDSGTLKAGTIRDQLRRHLLFGWYFLPHDEPVALPESIVDLRSLYTIPLPVVAELCRRGHRRCRIETPYREHLNQHLANTYGRIALPEPYGTQASGHGQE